MAAQHAVESWLVWASVVSYGISAFLSALRQATRINSIQQRLVFFSLLIGTLSLAVAIGQRWIRIDQGPFMTMYEVLLSSAFSLGLIYAFVYHFIPATRSAAMLIIPFPFMLAVWALGMPADAVHLPATFDNNWLWLHVLAGKFFLGTCLVSVCLSGVLLLNCLHPVVREYLNLQDVEQLDGLVWRFLAVAFIFDSLMLVIGAVWAYDAWGRYWAWDPLETWAFITWLAMATVLHLRVTFKLPLWSSWLMVIGVFILAFLTFFGVPFLNIAPHKGIM